MIASDRTNLVSHLRSRSSPFRQVIQREYLPLTHNLDFPPNRESKIILQIANFQEAFLYWLAKDNINIILVLGEPGSGKTNPCLFWARKLSRIQHVPFDIRRNLYVGEDVVMHRKELKRRHKRGEHIVVDEAELIFRSGSVQTRDLKWTLASIRGAGFNFWFMFPDWQDIPSDGQKLFNTHAHWQFHCVFRDKKKKIIEYNLLRKVIFQDLTKGKFWVDYPFPRRNTFFCPYIPFNFFKNYLDVKERIYDPSVKEDYWTRRNALDQEIARENSRKERKKRLLQIKKIVKSKLTKTDKVIEIWKLGEPISGIERRMKVGSRKINDIIDAHLLKEAELEEKERENT